MPNKVNPRLLSALGGSFKQMGVVGSLLYVSSAQAVTQFDASDDSATGVLGVIGRATVPNLSPDAALPMTAFSCTLQTSASSAAWKLRSQVALTSKGTLDLSAVVNAATGTITGLAVTGRHLFYTYSNSGLYRVGYALLSASNRDGDTTTGAVVNTTVGFRTTLPLREPVVVGDVLYVAENLGLATYDLKPVFFATDAAASGSVPVLLSESTSVDPARSDPVRMIVDGPFAYLVGGTYRVFDLR